MSRQQIGFVLRGQIAIMWHTLVEIVRHQIKQILLQIRAGTRNNLHFIAPNHLGQRNAKLGGTHRARQCNHHLAIIRQMFGVRIAGIN